MDRTQLIYLDTHVLVHLYLGQLERLSPAARRAIEGNELLASPAAVLELEFLHEIGRLRPPASKVMDALGADLGVRVCDLSFRAVVEQASREGWGRDPFDRLIVANAKARRTPLVTKDEKIQQHYPRAVW